MPTLGEQLREDWVAHDRRLDRPGLHAVAVHRLGTWGREQPLPLRLLVRALYNVLYLFVRNVYGIEIPISVPLGRRVRILHQSGIVCQGGAVIGDDCELRQNVTLGSYTEGPNGRQGAPTLQAGVSVGAGASIIGDVTIGEGARIGANATVLTDVPPGATAFARPAQILRPASARPAEADATAADAAGRG